MSFTTNVQSLQTFLLVVFGIVAGFGYLRWSKAQGALATIKLLNDQIQAQSLTISRLEGEKNTLTAKLEEQGKRIDDQTQRITGLTSMIQGIPAWSDLNANYQAMLDYIKPAIAMLEEHVREEHEIHGWVDAMHKKVVNNAPAV